MPRIRTSRQLSYLEGWYSKSQVAFGGVSLKSLISAFWQSPYSSAVMYAWRRSKSEHAARIIAHRCLVRAVKLRRLFDAGRRRRRGSLQ
jgi:hypothetical protein